MFHVEHSDTLSEKPQLMIKTEELNIYAYEQRHTKD